MGLIRGVFIVFSVVSRGQQGLASEIVAHFAFCGCTVLLSSAVDLPVAELEGFLKGGEILHSSCR